VIYAGIERTEKKNQICGVPKVAWDLCYSCRRAFTVKLIKLADMVAQANSILETHKG